MPTLGISSFVAAAVVLLLVLAADVVGAQRGVGLRGTPSFSFAQQDILPDFVVKPLEGDDDFFFSWEMKKDLNDNEVLVGTFNYTQDVYVAIGINSDKKMHGPIILCYVNRTEGEAICDDYDGQDYSIVRDQDATMTTNAALSGETATITFVRKVRLATQDAADAAIQMEGFSRVLFAKGKWYSSDQPPKQHEVSSRNAVRLNFVSGKVEKLESGYHKAILGGVAVVAVFCGFAARIAYSSDMQISSQTRRIATIALVIVYLASLGGYIFANYIDYIKTITPKASVRCFGDGAALALGLSLVPVAKRFVFSELLLVSHERAIKFHSMSIFVTIAIIGIHAGGMIVQYGTDKVFRWRDKDRVSKIPGLIAFACIILLSIPAGLRRFIGFQKFRMSHFFFPVVIFFAVCHYPNILLFLVPGGGLMLLSFIHRKFIVVPDEDEALETFQYDEASRIITLEICKNDVIWPGQWFLIGIPKLGIIAHPFSVSSAKQKGTTHVVRFRIQVTDNKQGWTQKLADIALSSKYPEEYRTDGPFGSIQVRPKAYCHFLFISGGIGITPHLYILQQIAHSVSWAIGATEHIRSIYFIWVVRSRAKVALIAPELLEYQQTMASDLPHIRVVIKIFITESNRGSSEREMDLMGADHHGGGSVTANDAALGITFGKRPDWDAELTLQRNTVISINEHPVPGRPSKLEEGELPPAAPAPEAVACYVSGPASFASDVRVTRAQNSKDNIQYHSHVEEFAF